MAAVIRIPICAHLVTLVGGGQSIAPEWDRAHLDLVLAESNRIWAQADIRFRLRAVTTPSVELPGDGSTTVDTGGFFFLAGRFGRRQEVNVACVRSVSQSHLGGRAARELNFTLLPYTRVTRAAGKRLAHELGHLLELPHPDAPRDDTHASHAAAVRWQTNLMYSGLSSDTRLDAQQIAQSRGSALASHFAGG